MQIHSMQVYEREVKRLLGAHDSEVSAYALGLAGEVGEVVDLLKKTWGHGHPLDSEKLKKELGDAMWYVIALALQFGIPVASVTPRRLIDDIGPEHRGQRALFLTTLVGRVNSRLLRFWYGDGHPDALFERRLARDLMQVFDQLEQLGLERGLSLGAILQANVDKLRLRYPAGFSTAASIARVDVKEIKVQGEGIPAKSPAVRKVPGTYVQILNPQPLPIDIVPEGLEGIRPYVGIVATGDVVYDAGGAVSTHPFGRRIGQVRRVIDSRRCAVGGTVVGVATSTHREVESGRIDARTWREKGWNCPNNCATLDDCLRRGC